MSNLSERLAQRKAELNDISVRAVSARAKADGHDLSANTVSKYLKPHHPVPVRATLDALAAGFQLPAAELHKLAGLPSEAEPFQAHASADLLTPPQRTAVNEIIRLLAEGNKGAAGATQAEDQAGSHPDVQSTRDRTPIDLAQARRVKDDPAAFGDQPRRGDLDQGKLQPPPPTHQSAAYEPRDGSEGIRGADESRDRGEENQDDGR